MRRSLSVTLLLTGLLWTACGRHESPHETTADLEPVAVKLAEVIRKDQERQLGLPGTIHPADEAVLAAKVMGTIAQIKVGIGEKVREGDILLVLEVKEIEAQVEQAQAMLAQLSRNLEREQNLLAQKATTAEAVRTLEDQIRVSRAQLAEAQTMESYTRVKAPFSGTITAKEVRRGDLALPGMPLLTLQGEGQRQVYLQVPDSLMALHYGSTVPVEANGKIFPGILSEWSPAADPASRTRLAKLDIPDDAEARSGQYVRVLWPAGITSSLCMPKAALSTMGQMERVFVYKDGRLQLRLVKTGAETGTDVQILSGLNEGDQVVLRPGSGIRDGQPATLLP